MKRTLLAAIMVFVALAQTGCGGGSSAPPVFVAKILSDSAVDGDITQFPPGIVTQGMTPTVQSVFAGIDPVTLLESRAFLDFPLTTVPANAIIQSAVLDIVINSIQLPTSTVPIRIDLVSPPSLTLALTDFNLSALATTTIVPPISPADVGLNTHVPVDVTVLMAEAQRLGLADFRVRISEDSAVVVAPPGLIEINDTTDPTNRGNFAPLLKVTFF